MTLAASASLEMRDLLLERELAALRPLGLGSSRIVASEKEVPIILVILA